MGGRNIDATWQDVATELDALARVEELSAKIVHTTGDEAREAARYRAANVLRREAALLREGSA